MSECVTISSRLKQSYAKVDAHGPTLEGGAWHGPSLMEALKGVDIGQAATRPIEGRHTIWEIVNHCTYWMGSVDKALHGEVMESVPETEDWVGMGETAEDWARDLERMDNTYEKLQETIEAEKPISSAIETEQELEIIKSLGFLTLKPIVVTVNIGEDQPVTSFDFAGALEENVPVITICAKLEYELAQLDQQSRQEFMKDLGITESATSKFVNSCYSALGLISFFTSVSGELRAWPIRNGAVAVDAAGKIHTDIKRGFIRAETFAFQDLKQLGNEKQLKAAGKIKLEGKDYVVQDGDVIHFRFNV